MQAYTKDKHNRLIGKIFNIRSLICFSISLGLVFNYFFSTDIIALICTVATILYIVFSKEEDALVAMIYMSFFSYLFRYGGYEIYVFVCVVFLCKILISRNKNLILASVVIMIYLVSRFISFNFEGIHLGDAISFVVLPVLIVACTIYKPSMRSRCISAFLGGFFVSAALGTVVSGSRITEYLSTNYVYSDGDQISRFSGLTYDPNFFAFFVVIVSCILLLDYKYRFSTNLLEVLAFVFVAWWGILTVSKSCLVCMAAIILFSMVRATVNKNAGIKILILGVALFAVYLFFFETVNNAMEVLLERIFGATDISKLTTGRVELWGTYLKDITESPIRLLLGHGFARTDETAAHNTLLEIIYKFGVVGIFFDFIYVFMSYRLLAGKMGKMTGSKMLIVGLFCAQMFFLSAYTFYSLWVCIFMIMILIKDKEENDELSLGEHYNSGVQCPSVSKSVY